MDAFFLKYICERCKILKYDWPKKFQAFFLEITELTLDSHWISRKERQTEFEYEVTLNFLWPWQFQFNTKKNKFENVYKNTIQW